MTKTNLNKVNTETGLNKRGRSAEWLSNYADMCSRNYEIKMQHRLQQQQANIDLQEQLKEDLIKILTGKN